MPEPPAVAEEIAAHSDDVARALAEHSWLERLPSMPVSTSVAAWDLGSGKSSVLSWAAAHPGCVAVIDDYAARTCAEVLGIPVVGTLGLALRAKRRGRIPLAGPLIEELRRSGLYLSDALIRDALALVGE